MKAFASVSSAPNQSIDHQFDALLPALTNEDHPRILYEEQRNMIAYMLGWLKFQA